MIESETKTGINPHRNAGVLQPSAGGFAVNCPSDKTVLVVNDSADQRELTRNIFLQAGYGVLTAAGGRAGFQTAAGSRLDLIISDVMMPDGDGIELCRRIRADAQLRRLPILLVSALRKDVGNVVEGLEAGADDYIELPVEPLHLIARAERLVERKRADDLLRESESHFRSVIENVSDLISIILPDGTILYQSPSLEQVLGFKPEQVIGKNIFELVHRDDKARVVDYFNENLRVAETSAPIEYRFRNSRGAWLDFESVGKFINDSSKGLVAVINSRGISERRQTEKALRASEGKFRKVLENSRDIIYQFNLKTRGFDYMSPAALELSGYRAEEFVGGGFSFSNSLVHPEDLNRLKTLVEEALSDANAEKTHHTTEYRLRNKAEEYRWISENRAVLRDENNTPTAIIATARDVTEQKQTEAALNLQKTLLQAQSEASLDGILVTNPTGKIISYNQRFLEMWGFSEEFITTGTREEILKTGFDRVADRRRYMRIVSYLNLHPQETYQTEVSLKCGRVLDLYAAPIIDTNKIRHGRVWFFHDITERRRVEELIRQSEEKYRTILESIEEGYYEIDLAGNYTFFNNALCASLGYERDEMTGMNYRQYADAATAKKLFAHFNEIFTTGQPLSQAVYEVIRKDGTRRVHETSGSLIRNHAGEPVGFRGVLRDVTERQQIENNLRRSEANLSAAQRITQLGSWEVELSDLRRINNNRVHWSDEVYRIFGYEPGAVRVSINRYFDSIHADDRRYCRRAFVEAVTDRKNLNIEFRVCLPTGGERILHGLAEAVYDAQTDQPRKLIGTVQDITERKRAEHALEEANQRAIHEYERLIDRVAQLAESLGTARDLRTIYRALYAFAVISAPCTGFFISLYDARRNVRLPGFAVSDGEEIEISDLPPMEMSGSPNSRAISTGAIVVEDDFQAAMTDKPVVNIGIEKHPDLPQSCLVAPMSVMGRIVGAVEVQSNQSAAYTKEHATAMRMAANLAANAIENVRLIEQEREHEERLRQSQKLESVGRLAGGIAHDFNNMLTAINGYSELTLHKLEAGSPLRQNIEEIKKAGERSALLTHQLLAFSRRQVLQSEVLNLNDVIAETSKMLEVLIGENVRLETNFDAKLGHVKGDAGQLTQVIMNLAVNARDAMPAGGSLIIKTANAYLDEEFAARHVPTKPGSYVMLAVADTGSGIDEETQENIFEPFYTTKEVGKGTGLGLATVYGIVKQSGGFIWLDSAIGVGSTFNIYLPCIDAEIAARDEDEAFQPTAKEAATILIVEDEDLVRAMTRQTLEECGYKVVEATNGKEALATCLQSGGAIDLVITDVVMPEMGGRELAERLREKLPNIRILFTSGYTDDAVVRLDVIEAETNFIQKPFTLEALTNKVKQFLDKKTAEE